MISKPRYEVSTGSEVHWIGSAARTRRRCAALYDTRTGVRPVFKLAQEAYSKAESRIKAEASANKGLGPGPTVQVWIAGLEWDDCAVRDLAHGILSAFRLWAPGPARARLHSSYSAEWS